MMMSMRKNKAKLTPLSWTPLSCVKALVAFAMEKYYVETDADSRLQRQLFQAVTGGLQFNTADVAADIRDAKGYGQYFSTHLETETIFSASDRDLNLAGGTEEAANDFEWREAA